MNWTKEELAGTLAGKAFLKADSGAQQATGGVLAPSATLSPRKASKKRLRQRTKGLTRLEQEWLDKLRQELPGALIRVQAITFQLGNGVTYRPDFTAVIAGQWTGWEIKGPWAPEDGRVKIKMAATVWPEIHWILCWKDSKTGPWRIQEILPPIQ